MELKLTSDLCSKSANRFHQYQADSQIIPTYTIRSTRHSARHGLLGLSQAGIVDRELPVALHSNELRPRMSLPRCLAPVAVVEVEEVLPEADEWVVMPVGCESLTSGTSDDFLVS